MAVYTTYTSYIPFSCFIDNAATGTYAWSNASYARYSDNSWTMSTDSAGYGRTHYLKCHLPTDSLATNLEPVGFEFHIEKSYYAVAPRDVRDNSIFVVKNGSVIGSDLAATAVSWDISDAISTYGSDTFVAGTTWNAGDINSTNFGIMISGRNHSSGSARFLIDAVAVKIYLRHGAASTQTMKLNSTVTRIASYHRTFPETMRIADALTMKLISVRTLTEAFKLDATVSARTIYGRNIAQAMKLADSVSIKTTYKRELSESAKLNAVASIYKVVPNSFLTSYKPKWLINMNLSTVYRYSHDDVYVDTSTSESLLTEGGFSLLTEGGDTIVI